MNTATTTKPYPQSTSSNKSENSVGDAARDAFDSAKSAVSDVADRGQAAVSHAVERGHAMASEAGEAANQMAQSATRQMKTVTSELETMIERNPLGTLAGAALAGFFLALLVRGRP